MKRLLVIISLVFVSITGVSANEAAPILSTPEQDQFFSSIKALCGKAFAGEIAVDNMPSPAFTNKRLVMHVKHCSEQQLQIPFHVGDDASRTWVITKTGSGLSLKHDHRHKDGTSDELTMYGGHTNERGWQYVQSFPADAPTQHMFVEQGLPQSNGNTWQLYIYPEKFSYRLVRQGREFRVDFDLTKEVNAP